MTKPNDGGPAFPRKLPDVMVPPARALEMLEEYSGMTLRDYFAGQALVGLLASCESDGRGPIWSKDYGIELEDIPGNVDGFAKAAYLHANAMLEERKALPPSTT